MNIEEAREFYLDMGGNYADDIVRLGNEFDLVEAGLRLKSLANYSRSNSSSVNESKNSSQRLLRRCTAEPALTVGQNNPNSSTLLYFLQANLKTKIMMLLPIILPYFIFL